VPDEDCGFILDQLTEFFNDFGFYGDLVWTEVYADGNRPGSIRKALFCLNARARHALPAGVL
jgi:hypothetical protein